MSHALDCSLFRLNPAGHHFTSVLLHTMNVILLYLFLNLGDGTVLAQPVRGGVVCCSSHQCRVGRLEG
jgi:hypothetical protein